ncbi:MAG: hypothetical protein IJJ69_01845 [Oscillospiraceae bacterium]|nr:hypothetical protein [Oscillospiraceae bacterium]
MSEWCLPLALLDIVPVALFFLGCIELMKAFYPRMTQAQYTMFASGGTMIFLAGMLKAVWKLLFVLKICDYSMLSDAFFPIQSTGFVLTALSMAGIVGKKKTASTEKNFSVLPAVPVIETKLPFIILTFMGSTVFYGTLMILSFRKKTKQTALFFIIAYVFNMMQVFLAIRFDNSSVMNWIAEFVNTMAQAFMLTGAFSLQKNFTKEYGNDAET